MSDKTKPADERARFFRGMAFGAGLFLISSFMVFAHCVGGCYETRNSAFVLGVMSIAAFVVTYIRSRFNQATIFIVVWALSTYWMVN